MFGIGEYGEILVSYLGSYLGQYQGVQ